ncbi:hypothetical protein [Diaphorobacter sp. HDW4B]|uniref:hypothetical protein n=1 Tax=Diaphorobacter sp. HDW4B TaxID=2714925 RepID=UPI00352F1A34
MDRERWLVTVHWHPPSDPGNDGSTWLRKRFRDIQYRIPSSTFGVQVMGFSANDVMPFTQARAYLSDLPRKRKQAQKKTSPIS